MRFRRFDDVQEQIVKGFDVFIDEVFDNYVVFVTLVGEVLLIFSEFLGHRSEYLLIENVNSQNVNQIRNLSPACICIEYASR